MPASHLPSRLPHLATWMRLLILGAVLLAPEITSVARADNLDEELMKQKKKIFKYIRARKARTVGVLKFKAQIGDAPSSFTIGPINSIMAERLETVLILGNEEDDPIRIIHDASAVAAAARKSITYLSADGRDALFALKYPLATGGTTAADLFLTGMVRVDPASGKAKVGLYAFDRTSARVESMNLFFEVPIDRSILADTGLGFALTREAMKKRGAFDELFNDQQAAQEVKEQKEKKKPGPLKSTARLVEIKMFLKGAGEAEEIPFSADEADPSQSHFRTRRDLRPGDKVYFTLTNLSNERVAVVLKVNGVNTLYEEKLDALHCTKWVLDRKDEKITVHGFYIADTGEKNLRPFRVVPELDASVESLADSAAGTIAVHLFLEGEQNRKPEQRITARGVSRLVWEQKRNVLQKRESVQQLLSENQPKPVQKSLITPDGAVSDGSKLRTVEFKDPREAQVLCVRYTDKK